MSQRRSILFCSKTERPTWNEIYCNWLVLEVVLHRVEAHQGMGAHVMTQDSRGEGYVGAVRLAHGRSNAIPPWPDQEANEANTGLQTML